MQLATLILGISAYYHDSAAALLVDGELIAAAQEERFTEKKHDAAFPIHAIQYVLEESGYQYADLTAIAFYDKALLKFERLLETYHAFAPQGFKSFATAVPIWIKEKLFMKQLLRKELSALGKNKIPLLFPEHHLSHAASAFYPSPFEEAAILTIDGVGEWATTTISYGQANQVTLCKELHFPHSVGLLYSAFTYYLGFKVNSGEYKLMGLAPYGDAQAQQTALFKKKILDELVDIREDGSILLNMPYFRYATHLHMTNDTLWAKLFGFPRRLPETEIKPEHANLASAIQHVTETIVLKLAQTAKQLTKSNKLVMAGGVALNSVANGKLLESGLFEQIWIQPAAGDAGGALGAAYAAYHIAHQQERQVAGDQMKNAYLGPAYTDDDIRKVLQKASIPYTYFETFDRLTEQISQKIAEGNIIGWFQGRAEFGPRALGNRSILADPRRSDMQSKLNLSIKFRESFRPFAPSVLEEDAVLYFDQPAPSPYMLFVTRLKAALQRPGSQKSDPTSHQLFEQLKQIDSPIPAVTHVDYSARVQTVNSSANPRFWQLIDQFKKITGCSALVNTSFNVRGKPIVNSPAQALHTFLQTDMDFLVLGNFLIDKQDCSALKRLNIQVWQSD